MSSTDSAGTGATLSHPASPIQAARAKLLRKICFMLVAMGVLMLGAYAFLFSSAQATVEGAIDELVQKSQQTGKTFEPSDLKQIAAAAIWTQQWTAAVFMALGAVYVALGILVFRWPVPITILALVLYLGSLAAIGIVDPKMATVIWPVKVVIVVGLWKAITAARSYERQAVVGANS